MPVRSSILSASLIGLIVAAATDGGASASTVCINATGAGTNYGPDASCTLPETESKVFFQDAMDVTTDLGNIGSKTATPVVDFTTGTTGETVDFASGYSTITPSAKGGAASFSTLDITIPGHSFTDLVFGLELLKTETGSSENLTIDAWDGTTLERSFTYSDLAHDANIEFTIADLAGLTAIDLSSTTGIKEAKEFNVSGVTAVIPEASTWAMALLGFAGLGYVAFRRGSRDSSWAMG